MKKTAFFLVAACFVMLSCTKEKTEYEAEMDNVIPGNQEFKEAIAIQSGDYGVSIEALGGTFFKGYNEIRLKITDLRTNDEADVSAATFLPIMANTDGSVASCPHLYDLVYRSGDRFFSGYSVFTSESSAAINWELNISFTIANQTHTVIQKIAVEEQVNKNLNMTAFTGKDDEQYVIALVSPQKPMVGENELIAGIYRFNKPTRSQFDHFPDPAQFSYTAVSGYTLLLDPRMPEPSMGNHSSPNNQDLTSKDDGLYHGTVNYTMTGNWTLNFIMQNQNGKTLKGTEVPSDFTPGVEGTKSELHIDVLF